MARALVIVPSKPSIAWPWLVIFGRTALFILLQVLFTLGFWLGGTATAWEAAAAWWPLGITLANVVNFAALIRLFRADGRNFWEIFRIRREHVKGDLLAFLGVMVIAGPIGYLPNVLLAGWLFGDMQTALH